MINFKELMNKIFSLYREEKFEEALEIVQKEKFKYLENLSRLFYFEACLLSVLGKKEDAIKTLNEALNFGFWWSVNTLNYEKDFNSIREDEEFKKVIEKVKSFEEEYKKERKNEYILIELKEYEKGKSYPLFISLHARDTNISYYSNYFKNIEYLITNYFILFPQSSQKTSFSGFSWDDSTIAYNDVLEITEEVFNKNNNISKNEIIISGASQGGRISLEIYLKNILPCKGWIGIIPAFKDINYLKDLLDLRKNEDLKFAFIVGAKDYFYEISKELNEEITKRGFKTLFIVNENQGHQITDNFTEQLTECIRFIK
ncbi:MAG: TPR end-of-group domain-containing protein [Caldisericia bacterium]